MGPPGIGRPFALGAVKFCETRGIVARFQMHIKVDGGVDAETLRWLVGQGAPVLAQLDKAHLFMAAWQEFRDWVYHSPTRHMPPVVWWADDWSDFAWLDIECRRHSLQPLRHFDGRYNNQFDSSSVLALVGPVRRDPNHYGADLIPHVAVDDATAGALDLLAALRVLGRNL